MSGILELNCWVIGEEVNRIITVKIHATENVNALRDAIKEEKRPAFDHAPADTLILWQIDIPDGENLCDAVRDLGLNDTNQLLSTKRLSGLFHVPPTVDHIHIVIQAPPLRRPEPQTTDRKLRLNCCVLGEGFEHVFTVKIEGSENVSALKKAIKEEKRPAFDHVPADTLILWKVDIDLSKDSNGLLERLRLKDNVERLESWNEIAEIFTSPVHKHLHVVVDSPNAASLKRSGTLEIDDSLYTPKKSRTAFLPRKWHVNSGTTQPNIGGSYFLDPGTQEVTQQCLDAIQANGFVLLHAARASGKTTRLFWLTNKPREMGYQALYISLEGVDYLSSCEKFWTMIGREISAALGDWNVKISSQRQFLDVFLASPEDPGQKYERVILLIDEFSELLRAQDTIRNEFLRALRRVKQDAGMYAISSIIAAGTFSIMHLNPTDPDISPFNISDATHSSNFSEETERLFQDFARDKGITVDDDVVSEIWETSNGHPGMVCLCGRYVSNRLPSLLDDSGSNNLSYRKWQSIPIEDLYHEINAYNTFHSMITSLCRSDVKSAVQLLRSQFAGFLEEVKLQPHHEALADFLTAQGVLLKPNVAMAHYHMASPLIDGLIRTRVIPAQFPNAPTTSPPVQHHDNAISILDTLIESLKFFDKDLIRMASFCSYKSSTVRVGGCSRVGVPRESVYDTELMRVLSNWLGRRYAWKVTGQWHLRTILGGHKSDIILQKANDPPIVLELLATGDARSVRLHIENTPEYMDLLSASEGWIVHFTREDDYDPIWQSDAELDKGINVVHFAHDANFSQLSMWARWKDKAGVIMDANRHVEI